MSYNGYKNYETWNIELWIDNDPGLYNLKLEILERSSEPIEGYQVKQFVNDYMNGTTPDIKDNQNFHINRVDWDELAELWEEERQEILGD